MCQLYNDLFEETYKLLELYQNTLFEYETDYSELIEQKILVNSAYTEFRINQPEIYANLKAYVPLPKFDYLTFLASPIKIVPMPYAYYVGYQMYTNVHHEENSICDNLVRIYTYLCGKTLQNTTKIEEQSNLKIYLQLASFLFPTVGDSLIFLESQIIEYPLLKRVIIKEEDLFKIKEKMTEDYLTLESKKDSSFMILYKNFIKAGLLIFKIANQMDKIKNDNNLLGIGKYYPEIEEDYKKVKYLKKLHFSTDDRRENDE